MKASITTRADLKRIQKKYNYTTVEFAKLLGVARQILQNIYSGRTKKVPSDLTRKVVELDLERQASMDAFIVTASEQRLISLIRFLRDEQKNEIWSIASQKIGSQGPF